MWHATSLYTGFASMHSLPMPLSAFSRRVRKTMRNKWFSHTQGLSHKVGFLLSATQKRKLVLLGLLLFVGMFFEMLGLGLVLPSLSLMLNIDVGVKYPFLKPYLDWLGNPTQAQLVFGCMIALVTFYALKSAFLLYVAWMQSRFSVELSSELSARLFLGYLKQPYDFHLQRNSAHLLANVRNEIGVLTAVSQSLIELCTEISVIVASAIILLVAEPIGAVFVTMFLGLSALCFHRLTRQKLFDWGKEKLAHSGLMNQHLLQGLGGIKDVKLFGREDYFLSRYAHHNVAVARLLAKTNALKYVPRLYLELLAVIGLAGLTISMLLQSKPLDFLLPIVGVFMVAAFRMLPSANRIMTSLQSLRTAQPAIEVLYKEFCLIGRNAREANIFQDIKFVSELRVENLFYQYPCVSSNALIDISLVIKKGESVGLMGQSGSGKSTLADVILGLLSPSIGTVSVAGQNIHKNSRAWQKQVGYVPQSIYLTDDTIERNIAFGLPDNEIDPCAIKRALHAAQLDEFVKSLPEGIHTLVGERGIRLSGGQRQRIGIARALYRDPPILVLDEATSALDTETEKGVMQAVAALQGQKTILIIAHRLSTLEHCDRVYRLEKGRLVVKDALLTTFGLEAYGFF